MLHPLRWIKAALAYLTMMILKGRIVKRIKRGIEDHGKENYVTSMQQWYEIQEPDYEWPVVNDEDC